MSHPLFVKDRLHFSDACELDLKVGALLAGGFLEHRHFNPQAVAFGA